MEMEKVDARGLSCPMPVLEVQKVLSRMQEGTVEVLVDMAVSRDNVSRFARRAGWSVTVEEEPDGTFKLLLKK